MSHLDAQSYELHRAGKPVSLRPKVLAVLAYLLAHRERVVSKDEILGRLWPGQFVSDATLNACVMEIHKAIGDRGAMPRLLRTVRGRGYRFVALVREHQYAAPDDLAQLAALPTMEGLAPDSALSLDAFGTAHVPDRVSATAPGGDEAYNAVTVLCSAVAEAPALAARLRPEAMYRLMLTIVADAADVARRYEGAIVYVTGESFTALLGAPAAQEDHARRAVLAALELRQRLHEPAAIRSQMRGCSLAACMGLHTGPAVVGRLVHEPQRLYTAIGPTVQLATRRQHLAKPRTILISASTHQLVQTDYAMPSSRSPEHERVCQYLREAESLAKALGDQRRLGWVFSYMTRHFLQTADHNHAVASGERALAIAVAFGDFGLQIVTKFFLGQAYYFRGEYHRAVHCLDSNVVSLEGAPLAERFGL
jgi:DNA-binding winged helix-turn-helix (wHTH) protein